MFSLYLLASNTWIGLTTVDELPRYSYNYTLNGLNVNLSHESRTLTQFSRFLSISKRKVTGDSWYSGVENLKFLRNQKLGFLFGIEKNRTVSNSPGKYCQVSSLDIPDEGLVTHLREFGFIKLFRKVFSQGETLREQKRRL